jgi:hypothetical protein
MGCDPASTGKGSKLEFGDYCRCHDNSKRGISTWQKGAFQLCANTSPNSTLRGLRIEYMRRCIMRRDKSLTLNVEAFVNMENQNELQQSQPEANSLKLWHDPEIKILDVRETKQRSSPGIDASDSVSTAS